jgi:hypothetical protein
MQVILWLSLPLGELVKRVLEPANPSNTPFLRLLYALQSRADQFLVVEHVSHHFLGLDFHFERQYVKKIQLRPSCGWVKK